MKKISSCPWWYNFKNASYQAQVNKYAQVVVRISISVGVNLDIECANGECERREQLYHILFKTISSFGITTYMI